MNTINVGDSLIESQIHSLSEHLLSIRRICSQPLYRDIVHKALDRVPGYGLGGAAAVETALKLHEPIESWRDHLKKQVDTKLNELVKEFSSRQERLTEDQFKEALRQAIDSGDFLRHVHATTQSQQVTYLPYRQLQEWKHRAESAEKQLEVIRNTFED